MGSFFLVLVLLIGVTLRAFITAVPPALSIIQHDLGLSRIESGLTTSLPLLCFGVFSFLAPLVSRRIGVANSIGLALILTIIGGMLRIWPVKLGLFMGILLIGLGISIGNVIVPVSIRRNCAERVALPMTVFSFGLNLGAALGATLTIPLITGLGWSWNWALAIWPALTVLIALGWWAYSQAQARQQAFGSRISTQAGAGVQPVVDDPQGDLGVSTVNAATSSATAEAPSALTGAGDSKSAMVLDSTPKTTKEAENVSLDYRSLFKNAQIWLLLGFMGNQSLSYYTQMTWLPEQLQSTGLNATQAGFWLGIYSLLGMLGGTFGPAIVCSRKGRPLMAAVFIGYGVGAILVLQGGLLTMAGIVFTGLAQGITFSAILTLIVHLYSEQKVAAVSAVVQGCGYLVAACGPIINGIVLSLFTGWVAPTCLLLLSMTIGGFCAVLAIPRSRRADSTAEASSPATA